jgi:hypothetical protein
MPFVGPTFAELQMQQQEINNKNEQEAIRSATAKWQDVKNRQSAEVDKVLQGKYAGDYVAMSNSADAPLLKSFLNGVVPNHEEVVKGLQDGFLTPKYLSQLRQQMYEKGILTRQPEMKEVFDETKTDDVSLTKPKIGIYTATKGPEQVYSDQWAPYISKIKNSKATDFRNLANEIGNGNLAESDRVYKMLDKWQTDTKESPQAIIEKLKTRYIPEQDQTLQVDRLKSGPSDNKSLWQLGFIAPDENGGHVVSETTYDPKLAQSNWDFLPDAEKKAIADKAGKTPDQVRADLADATTASQYSKEKGFTINTPYLDMTPNSATAPSNGQPTTQPSNGNINANENSSNPTAQPSAYTRTSKMVPTGKLTWAYTPEAQKELKRGNKSLEYFMNSGYKDQNINMLNQAEELSLSPELELANPLILTESSKAGLMAKQVFAREEDKAEMNAKRLELIAAQTKNADARTAALQARRYADSLKPRTDNSLKNMITVQQNYVNSLKNDQKVVNYYDQRAAYIKAKQGKGYDYAMSEWNKKVQNAQPGTDLYDMYSQVQELEKEQNTLNKLLGDMQQGLSNPNAGTTGTPAPVTTNPGGGTAGSSASDMDSFIKQYQ